MVSLNGDSSRSTHGLPVLKLQPSRSALVTMCSEDILVINTHWLGRRIWCAEADCPACLVSPVRSVAYVVGATVVDGSLRPTLVETTVNEIARMTSVCKAAGFKLDPGLVCEARKARQRSPMRLEPIEEGGRVLGDWTSPRRCLAAAAVLANVPVPAAEGSISEYFAKIRPALLRQIETAPGMQD